jgi:hypothetical protein
MRALQVLVLLVIGLLSMLVGTGVSGRGERSLRDTPIGITSITQKDLNLRLAVVEESLFDAIKCVPGKKVVSNSQPTAITRGWSCQTSGNSWNCGGPETNGAYISFELESGTSLPGKIDLELGYRGKTISSQQISPSELGRIEVIKGPADMLYVPPGVGAGDVFMVTPKTPIPGGRWTFHAGDTAVEPLDESALSEQFDVGSAIPRDRLFFSMPKAATGAADYRFTFDGPFGERWVDAIAPDYLWGGAEDPPCEPALDVCQERAVVDGTLCLCGCFPDLTWLTMTLDGKPIPTPRAASAGMIRFPLPEGIEPGPHTIAWPTTGQSAEFEAVRVRGSIDQALLQKGQSTGLTFGLDGTQESLPIQTAWTSGGGDNKFNRMLFASGVGPFSIDYKFTASVCPCSGAPETSLVDESSVTHPFSAEGNLDSRMILGGKGLFPSTLSADSIVVRTPRPPFEEGGDLEVEFVQLGLKALTPGYPEFVYEERADARSVGRFRGIELTPGGGFAGGEVDLELYADFTTAFSKKLPIKVGKSYELGLSGFELTGMSPGLGQLTLTERPGTDSTLELDEIRRDAAGTTLYGKATFRLYGLAKMDIKF